MGCCSTKPTKGFLISSRPEPKADLVEAATVPPDVEPVTAVLSPTVELTVGDTIEGSTVPITPTPKAKSSQLTTTRLSDYDISKEQQQQQGTSSLMKSVQLVLSQEIISLIKAYPKFASALSTMTRGNKYSVENAWNHPESKSSINLVMKLVNAGMFEQPQQKQITTGIPQSITTIKKIEPEVYGDPCSPSPTASGHYAIWESATDTSDECTSYPSDEFVDVEQPTKPIYVTHGREQASDHFMIGQRFI